MSRDRRPDASEPAVRPGDTAGPGPDRCAELLTAYVDGVAELPPDERHAVERWLADQPAARADADAVHQLLGELRALPPEDAAGAPPDWAAMERSIRQAVDAQATRPWWRRWQWLVPAMTCTAAAAVALALWPRPVAVLAPPAHDREPPTHDRAPAPADDVLALWLDGGELDVELSPSALGDLLGALDADAGRAVEPGAVDEAEPADATGVLPAAGLAWIDDLDDAALDRAERALAGAPADPARPAPPAAVDPARSKG